MSWTPPSKPPEILAGQRVLIVDDESVIALELEFVVGDAGAVVVGPAGNIEDAIALAEDETLSVAVLDVRLNGRTIDPVADLLAQRGIPFVFYSGQVQGDASVARWPGAPFIAKPASAVALTETIADLVAQNRAATRPAGVPPEPPPELPPPGDPPAPRSS